MLKTARRQNMPSRSHATRSSAVRPGGTSVGAASAHVAPPCGRGAGAKGDAPGPAAVVTVRVRVRVRVRVS